MTPWRSSVMSPLLLMVDLTAKVRYAVIPQGMAVRRSRGFRSWPRLRWSSARNSRPAAKPSSTAPSASRSTGPSTYKTPPNSACPHSAPIEAWASSNGTVSDSPRVSHRWARMVRGRCPEPVANHRVGKWWPGTDKFAGSELGHAQHARRARAMDGPSLIEPSTRGFSVARRARLGASRAKERNAFSTGRPNRPVRPSLFRTPEVGPDRATQ